MNIGRVIEIASELRGMRDCLVTLCAEVEPINNLAATYIGKAQSAIDEALWQLRDRRDDHRNQI